MSTTSPRVHRFLLTGLALLLVVSAAASFAEESAETSEPATAADNADAPLPIMGMQVWIDEETGELRAPTALEASKLSAAIEKMFAGVRAKSAPVHHENGMISAEVPYEMLDFSVVRVQTDGSLDFDCVEGPDAALATVEADTHVRPEEE